LLYLLRRKYPPSLIWDNTQAPRILIIAGYRCRNRRTAMEPNPVLSTSDEIAAAYLEWLDASPEQESRESILLNTLRAQRDCVHALETVLAMKTSH
jgi:hypothetical protein